MFDVEIKAWHGSGLACSSGSEQASSEWAGKDKGKSEDNVSQWRLETYSYSVQVKIGEEKELEREDQAFERDWE